MTSIGSPSPFFFGGKKAHEVERSLRFNSGSSHYLVRTPSSASNRKTFTFSSWIKRGNLGVSNKHIFAIQIDGSNQFVIRFTNSDILQIYDYQSASMQLIFDTNAVFRDVSAWYHIVVAVDTTQSTNTDRFKLYVNGSQVTSFSNSTYPSQNHNTLVNTTNAHDIGQKNSALYFDGYMAEINFVDGQAYDASYFGETDPITGQWNPIDTRNLTFGTNGFTLNFSDNSSTTASTLGKDTSGNGNNFTPNNFGATAHDQVKDTPTNNFATWNPISTRNLPTLSEGNLKNLGDNNKACNATFGVTSGKWYWEMHILTDISTTSYIAATGVTSYQMENEGDTSPALASAGRSYYRGMTSGGVYAYKNYTSTSNTEVSSGGTFYGGAVISFRLDMDTGTLKYYTNNTLVHTDSTIPTDGTVIFPMQNATNSGVSRHNASIVNFGQDGTFAGNKTAQGNADENGIGNFFYAVPSGHKALCSANLPDPTIKLPNKHFEARTYTGTTTGSGTQTLTGFQFQPDWVWIKSRAIGYSHLLVDAVRGASKGLLSEAGDVEETSNGYGMLTAFTSDGYTMTRGSSDGGKCCENTQTYVAWNWDAGETDGKTYTVKVVSDSGNKYRFDDFGTSAVTLDLAEGGTYIFDQSDSSNAGHPLRFSTTSNGTHGGGSEYTIGVTTAGTPGQSGAYTQIVVAASAPTLYYYCTQHSGMGGQANTNSTLGSSNFDGTTQSTVKANATAGFSIVTYTGTGSNTNIGHGLGVAPQVVITKARSAANSWAVLHTVGDPNAEFGLFLNDNGGYSSYQGGTYWNDTVPTSTHFRVSSNASTNASGVTYVGYVFSAVEGYSKFGVYFGNGSSDGTFIHTNFKVAWLMVKMVSGSNSWAIYDNKRNLFNVVDDRIRAQLSNAEDTHIGFDFLSNGFKTRNASSTSTNQNGSKYIYFAFAESPFKNARAR